MHNKEINDVFKELNTTIKGLNEKEVNLRIEKYGYNELPKAKKETILKMFFNQLKNPIIYILLIATVLSFFIGEIVDAIFIVVVILLDTVLGAFQEFKAVKNSEALEDLIKSESMVVRNSKQISLESKLLVIGDIVMLSSGDKINADIRLCNTHNLEINESILTGESLPTNKHSLLLDLNTNLSERKNMAYAGTIVTKGRGTGVVIATGIKTEIGKIADTVLSKENEKSPLMHRMERFTKQVSYFIAVLALIIIIILHFKGYAPKELFFSVVALSVSAIPSGLPVALTLALSIASSRMSKKNVIVKKLNSVESLGSCTIIASDKTGTLTVNEQTAKKIWLTDSSNYGITGVGYNDDGEVINSNLKVKEIALMGLINNEASLYKNEKWEYIGDSIDVAFLSLAYKLKIEKNIKIIQEIPYESENKYSAVFYEENDLFCTVKGSLEKILTFCKDNNKSAIEQNELFAKEGYRVIALAKGIVAGKNENDIKDLELLGLVAFIDPIRNGAIEAIENCKKSGIKVLMITGDHPLTAFSIAKELKLVNSMDEVTNYDELIEVMKKGEKHFDEFIKNKIVFSRVTPIQKLEIVESFKRQGEFIAVTGDGVNDAPALKSANIGIAMGSGTDVAKEASTMIITDDNFVSIVSGIEEGRVAYNNVRKVIYLLISCGFAEVMFFLLAILFNLPLPLIAIQLLWLNLVTDGLQDAALAFEKKDMDVLSQKPRNPKENIFDKMLIIENLIIGIVMGVIVFLTFKYLLSIGVEIGLARGYIVLLVVFMQNFHALNGRSEYISIFKLPLKNNYLVVGVILFTFLLQMFVSQNSYFSNILGLEVVNLSHTVFLILLALPILIVGELMKVIIRKQKNI